MQIFVSNLIIYAVGSVAPTILMILPIDSAIPAILMILQIIILKAIILKNYITENNNTENNNAESNNIESNNTESTGISFYIEIEKDCNKIVDLSVSRDNYSCYNHLTDIKKELARQVYIALSGYTGKTISGVC